jgi:hypothetical protein
MWLLWLLLFLPQDKGEPTTLHVKEVTRTQDEGTEKGTWFHIKVQAESKTILYGLSCDEFISPKGGYRVSCFHLKAGQDYSARVFPTAVSFWPVPASKEDQDTLLAVYDILSQKEK